MNNSVTKNVCKRCTEIIWYYKNLLKMYLNNTLPVEIIKFYLCLFFFRFL